MKKLFISGGMSLLLIFGAATVSAGEASVQDLYREGVIAMNQGNAELAKAKFSKVLSLDPSHGNARLQLIRVSKKNDSLSGLAKKNELKQITIKDIDLKDAKLSEALEYFTSLIDKETKKPTNFIVQDPEGKLNDKRVNLRLQDVPATVVLDYILRGAGAKATYRKHAVEISPAS